MRSNVLRVYLMCKTCKAKTMPNYQVSIYKKAMEYLSIEEAETEETASKRTISTENQDRLNGFNPNYHSYYDNGFDREDCYHKTKERDFHPEVRTTDIEQEKGEESLLDNDVCTLTQTLEDLGTSDTDTNLSQNPSSKDEQGDDNLCQYHAKESAKSKHCNKVNGKGAPCLMKIFSCSPRHSKEN